MNGRKLCFINSSYRGKKGLSSLLIDNIVRGARSAGADCDVVTLAGQRINRCLDCGFCQSRPSLGRCVHQDKDDVDSIYQTIAKADVVVYASPVYVLGISGLLKIFLDRVYAYGNIDRLKLTHSGMFFHDIPTSICSKPFVSLICCDNFEERVVRNCEDYFRTLSVFHDAKRVGRLVRNSGKLLMGQNEIPAAGKERILRAYEQAGRELGRDGKISACTQREANREVIPVPFFHYLKHLGLVKRAVLKRASSTQESAK